ncbi:hypothetical protein [Desulfuribacillus alkaliarsenatis]|uniref:Uncharacterized protein n=1 Tax=Desulfuribacillus alkaliarsenatis TaxID=766136 RepID=A0A1E5G3I9_9FIRM|nr:hypothetical protein [Desulfuribacillus alkaliarsenatis]OEF97617.1 hypothetical protein BHF68_14575 [Desulfuribacillus alkaliarsenatis]
MKDSFTNNCPRGLNRGNKLYEGHRMMLPEHKEKVIESKRRDYSYAQKEIVVQEEEDKEQAVRKAIETGCIVEICWQETINPIKLNPEEYAAYLHKVFNPKAVRETEIRTEQGRIAGIFSAQGMLKCKLRSGNQLIPIESLLYIREISASY